MLFAFRREGIAGKAPAFAYAAPATRFDFAPREREYNLSRGAWRLYERQAPRPGITTPAPSAARLGLIQALANRAGNIQSALISDPSGRTGYAAFQRLYSNDQRSSTAEEGAPTQVAPVVNDEGIKLLWERPLAYYREAKRLVQVISEKYKQKHGKPIDLNESLDIMNDTYWSVWAKLKILDAIARTHGAEENNVHLERTLTWIDGLIHNENEHVAIHTYQVYFHHAKNPKSEIEEGKRRIVRELKNAAWAFRSGGKAEAQLGKPLDQVILAFDTRGYQELKDFVKTEAAKIADFQGDRFKLVYLDEIAQIPPSTEAMRQELNALIQRYQHEREGLQKIIEGVIYSRYVGLLLELKAIEYYVDRGYEVLQSGRELFDQNGMYKTELDVVVRTPLGRVMLVEAKSLRVTLSWGYLVGTKIVEKLQIYKENRVLLESILGSDFGVVFFLDVGRNKKLIPYIRAKAEKLSREFGFPVSFVFKEILLPDETTAPQSDDRPASARAEDKIRRFKKHRQYKHGKFRRH